MNFTKEGLWFLEQQNSETFFGGLHHARLSASVSLTSDDLPVQVFTVHFGRICRVGLVAQQWQSGDGQCIILTWRKLHRVFLLDSAKCDQVARMLFCVECNLACHW